MATTAAASVQTNLTRQAIGGNSTFDNDNLMAKSNAEDAIWILSCTFIIFTMQSGKVVVTIHDSRGQGFALRACVRGCPCECVSMCHVCMCMCACVYVCMCACVHVCMYACVHVVMTQQQSTVAWGA